MKKILFFICIFIFTLSDIGYCQDTSYARFYLLPNVFSDSTVVFYESNKYVYFKVDDIIETYKKLKYACPNGCKDATFTPSQSSSAYTLEYFSEPVLSYDKYGNVNKEYKDALKEYQAYRLNKFRTVYKCSVCREIFEKQEIIAIADSINKHIADSLFTISNQGGNYEYQRED